MHKLLFTIVITTAVITPVFADGFDAIKPADPLNLKPQSVNTIALPIKKATLTHNSLHNQYVIAFDRFVQSNVKSAYNDFKILIETMAQCGGAGLGECGAVGPNSLFFLATVDKAKFRRQVRPGEEVRMEITNLRVSPKMIKQAGKAYVGEELAAEAEWLCLVGEA